MEICQSTFEHDSSEKSPLSSYIRDPHGSHCSLQGLLHFARASKLSRGSMRASIDLLPSLEHFLSEKYTEQVDLDVFLGARNCLAQLVEALTMSEDSRSWIIEVGYMKLLAGIFRTAHLQQDKEATEASSFALLRLSRFPKCVELMRKYRVHLLMEPHSRIIESSFPVRGFWKDFERRIRAGICESSCDLKYCRELAKLERSIVYQKPTVCSWEGCTIQLQAALSKTTKFSKCACCSVAHCCPKTSVSVISAPYHTEKSYNMHGSEIAREIRNILWDLPPRIGRRKRVLFKSLSTRELLLCGKC